MSDVNTIAGRTLVRDAAGRWLDTAWDRRVAPQRVEALSDAWFALQTRSPEVARLLALGERVVFVLGEEVFEIVPAGR